MNATTDLIGSIYDCALDPERWPAVLGRIGSLARCSHVSISTVALDGSEVRFLRHYGTAAEWIARYKPEYVQESARYFQLAFDQIEHGGTDIDRPLVLSRQIPRDEMESAAVYREWAAPQGLCDTMAAVMLATPHRVLSVILMRHRDVGMIDDDAVDAVAHLVPHLRRAITISDLIDEQRLSLVTLQASLDSLAPAVVIVDADARVLEANATADLLVGRGTPIGVDEGRLVGETALVTKRLRSAIVGACIGTAESAGVRLTGEGTACGMAHVLPLVRGALRRNHPTPAAAAVFVSGAGIAPRAVLDGIASAYGLTDGEKRLLSEVAGGESVGEAAAALGITVATARTHMKRIFAKLGVKRHAELVGLVQRLAPPVGGVARRC